DVSQVLSSSLNYEEGLDRLARVASSTLCDLCLIDLLDPEDGSIRRVAAQAARVERQPLADTLRRKYPPDPAGQHPAVRVMQTGEPEWAPEMEESFLAATTGDAEHRRVTEALLSSQAEAGIEGVLVVSSDGAIISFNSQLAEMWSIPQDLLESRDADALLGWVTRLVEDPESFAARVRHLRAYREESGRDEIRLADGRVFDRWTAPLMGDDAIYRRRAWYFRAVSDLKQAQEERGRLYEAELVARLQADRGRTRLA